MVSSSQRRTLGDSLRSDARLAGTHLGCEHRHTTPTPRAAGRGSAPER